jgi:hypothetical protein
MTTVYDKAGRPVEAKPLLDRYGNEVINPRTGEPFLVPLDYNPNRAIAEGQAIRAMIDRALADGARRRDFAHPTQDGNFHIQIAFIY